MQQERQIAFFDLDGTITNGDTMLEFIRYARGDFAFLMGMLLHLPLLAAMRIGIVPNQRAKEKILAHFFSGTEAAAFEQLGKAFCAEKSANLIRPFARSCIAGLQNKNIETVIVSASPEEWVAPIADQLGMRFICSKMEKKNGKISGKLIGLNCYGAEKLRRIAEQYNLDDYDHIYAFGDSKGDSEMLSIAHSSYYRPFVKNNPVD